MWCDFELGHVKHLSFVGLSATAAHEGGVPADVAQRRVSRGIAGSATSYVRAGGVTKAAQPRATTWTKSRREYPNPFGATSRPMHKRVASSLLPHTHFLSPTEPSST
jgi:hypothetical protein